MQHTGKSKSIRVPNNTHPSHLTYGSCEEDDMFYSAHGTPASISHSFGNTLSNFAGSYSRTSVLYVADSLPVPSPQRLVEHQEELPINKTEDLDFLYRTSSQRTEYSIPGNQHFPCISRHTTVGSILSQQLVTSEVSTANRSSFIQSVFNAINVLIGVGILALPLSLRLAGWFFGSLIFLFCCLVTSYTAKIIVKCLSDGEAATYADMGEFAFGMRGRHIINFVFITELITIGVAMIILLGDGIQTLYPELGLVQTRILSYLILLPTVFLPIRKLAYTSLIGIIACICLVIIVLYDGVSKLSRPGSLHDPMVTEIIPNDLSSLPLSFGLIMSGFAGHAVFPSIYRDMKDKSKYNKMVNISYLITAVTYVIMAIAGYLMFGQEAMQEISQNIAMIEEYNKSLNHFAIWLLVMTPMAKYGLMMHPLNMSCELWLQSYSFIQSFLLSSTFRKQAFNFLTKVFLTMILVYIAIVFPGFDRVMSLLGALFSFSISIIFPLLCHLSMFKYKLSAAEVLLNWFLLIVSIMMAATGTVWSFAPNEL